MDEEEEAEQWQAPQAGPPPMSMEDPAFQNPLYQSQSYTPLPQRGFEYQQSNPVWSPGEQAGQHFSRPSPPPFPPPVASTSGAPPPTGVPRPHGTSERPEDKEFAAILAALMQGELDVADAVREFAIVCRQRAMALREDAGSQAVRAARRVHLRDEAAALDAEAATWHLLWHLHGARDRDFPAGLGGPLVPGCGGRRTTRQRIADLIASEEDLNRAARVVAWLEFLAAEALDMEEQAAIRAGGSGARFARDEGVWKETRLKVAAGSASRPDWGLVAALDPDAPSRQRKGLAPDNAADEERLLSRIWRLIRAGRVAAARQLCEECGQPWRAASLGGAGAAGPLPLGQAAEETDDADPAAGQAQDLAAEVDLGEGSMRALWRWACYQAAEQTAAAGEVAHQGPGAAIYEAAIYGALSGHVARVLPVCGGWEDACWALFRSWLECTLDLALPPSPTEDGVSLDVLAAAAAATPPEREGGADGEVLAQGLSILHGNWPLRPVLDALPPSFEAVFEEVEGSEVGRPGGGFVGQQRAVQRDLILHRTHHLTRDNLRVWVLRGGSEEGGGGGAGGGAVRPPCSPAMMRFAAHLALALRALDIASATAFQDNRTQFDDVQDALNKVLQAYIAHLMDSGQDELVPQYCCHLRQGLRHISYGIFLEELTARPLEECHAAYELADAWFTSWRGGDTLPHEMTIIADKVAQAARRQVRRGPGFRAQAARWLCFSPATLPQALRHAGLLARELAAGGPPCARAAWQLLFQVLPQAMPDAGLLDLPDEELRAAYGDATLVAVQEARCWGQYFGHERQYGEWEEVHRRLLLERSTPLAPEEQQLLLSRSSEALQAALAFLASGALEAVVGAQPAVEGRWEAALLLVPEDGSSRGEEVERGDAYPALRGGEEADAALGALQQALAAARRHLPDTHPAHSLRIEVQPGREEYEGLLSLLVGGEGAEAAAAAVRVLGLAVKGALPGARGAGAGPLHLINLDAPDALSLALLHTLLLPRVALQAAQLRQVAVALGAEEGTGAELVPLLAAAETGVAGVMTQAEVADLLELERATALLALRNAERAAAAAQLPQQ